MVKRIKSPWARLLLGLFICIAFLCFLVVSKFVLSGFVVIFLLGTFLVFSATVEIFTGKDLINVLNQLKIIDLLIYIPSYVSIVFAMLYVFSGLFLVRWSFLIEIIAIVSAVLAIVCWAVKKLFRL